VIDTCILLRVRCRDFNKLKKKYESDIFFDQVVGPPDTYEVVASNNIDREALRSCAQVETPYNPTAPDEESIKRYGAEMAKALTRKNFLDRWCCWCRWGQQKGVLAAYLYHMAEYFQEDFMWIVNYCVTRAFATEPMMDTPLVVTNYKLLGVRIHSNESQFQLELKKYGFDESMVLSNVKVHGNLHELWVSNEALQTFNSQLDVQSGFDPMLCSGAFNLSEAQERLLKRIRKLDSRIQLLYLYHLKLQHPDTHRWILGKLWQKSEKNSSKKTFWITGIGGYNVELPLSSRGNVRVIVMLSSFQRADNFF
jgi:hypothetical protein